MSPEYPGNGIRLRLFLCGGKKLDGVTGVKLDRRYITFLREGQEIYERLDWDYVYSYNRLDTLIGTRADQGRLPLEGG